jgi:ankyrin repeat protein
VDGVGVLVILTNEGEFEPTHGRGNKISMITVDEGIKGKYPSGVVELHRLDWVVVVGEFIHPVLYVCTSLPTESLGFLTNGLHPAPFGSNRLRKRVITLFFYRFSSAQIVKRSVVETYSHSVHGYSLGNVNKSVLLGGNENFWLRKCDLKRCTNTKYWLRVIIGICYLVSKYKGLLMKKNVIIFCLLVIICTIPLTASDLFSIVQSATSVEIKQAISNGADVNARNEEGNTPLMLAAFDNENHEVIRALLDAGADVNARDIKGFTPLIIAAQYNNPEVINTLLEAGGEVNAKTEDGITPLMLAALDNENHEVIRVLLDAGADVNARDIEGFTPSMLGVWDNENPEVIRMLLDAGADVNAININGWTSLMFAARDNKNPEVIRVLLDAGAEVNAKKRDDWTPLMLAASDNENPEVIRVLLKAGADGSIKNFWGKTALDYAKENEALKGTKAYWELNDASYK